MGAAPARRPSAARAREIELLRAYHARIAQQELDAKDPPAPAAPHVNRSRFSGTAEPINPMRRQAIDGPPPAGFDADNPDPRWSVPKSDRWQHPVENDARGAR